MNWKGVPIRIREVFIGGAGLSCDQHLQWRATGAFFLSVALARFPRSGGFGQCAEESSSPRPAKRV